MKGAGVRELDIVEFLGIGQIDNRFAGAESVADGIKMNGAPCCEMGVITVSREKSNSDDQGVAASPSLLQ